MSLFRNRRLSVDQLHAILRSLPQAQATADLEDRLNHVIAEHSDHIPHVLGTLPLISAPDDFDARLMNAIRTQQRPAAPIPHWGTSDAVAVNWFTHVTGWIGGIAVAVGLAFFIHSVDNSVRPASPQASAPVAVVAPESAPRHLPIPSQPSAPAPQTPASRQDIASSAPQAAATPQLETPAADRVEAAPPESSLSHPAVDATLAPERQHPQLQQHPRPTVSMGDEVDPLHGRSNSFTGQQHSVVPPVTHEPAVNHGTIPPPHESTGATPTPAKADSSSNQGANAPAPDSNDVSAQSGMGQVDTGRERIGQDSDRSKP